MSFSRDAKYLAIGDYGGRCILFEKSTHAGTTSYEYSLELQAHDKTVDFYNN
jgi:hypothetical protein